MKSKALNIVIPKELYDQLKEEAKNKNISMASVVRIASTEYLQKNNR